MPYIKPDKRQKYQEGIDSLLGAFNSEEEVKMGDVNYVVSTIIWELFKDKLSYAQGNNLMGALECVKQEFYRRMLVPYEDEKIKENGDIG
jgi:hypothetical protein